MSKIFEIKVGDLLKTPGKKDTIIFEEKNIEELPNIQPPGIKGSLEIQSLNDSTVLATLTNISCTTQDSCDRCLAKYTREILCPEYKARFIIPEPHQDDDQVDANDDEELFPIDAKSENIDIQEMILQSILLQEPISKRCPQCINIPIEQEDQDDVDYLESNMGVTFSKGK